MTTKRNKMILTLSPRASASGVKRSIGLCHRSVMRVSLVFALVLGLSATAIALHPDLVGYDPSGQIRFSTPAEADAKRQKLINYIWPSGLPTTVMPNVTTGLAFPADLLVKSPVDASLVSAVSRLDFNIKVPDPVSGDWSLPSTGYLLTPSSPLPTSRLAIFHTGHQFDLGLDAGNAAMVNALLEKGIHVIQLDMPMNGRNNTTAGRTLIKPDGTTRLMSFHSGLFTYKNTLEGGVFAFFLEPVVQSINYFISQHPTAQDVTMIGKSGGGWTAHMVAAIDTRIDLSFPVAGASPLYTRPYNKGGGDTEQIFSPLYLEIDGPDVDTIRDTAAGVASWLEIFALGGYGSDRHQIQILNFNDSCCFSGDSYETYDDFVSGKVDTLGEGNWDFHSDATHSGHIVSDDVRENVILPAMGIFSAPPLLTSLSINSGSSKTFDQVVTLNYVSSGGTPAEYMASEDASFAGASWQPYASVPTFMLSSGYGTKTVYMKVRNPLGTSVTQNDSIDYVLPDPPALTSLSINNGNIETFDSIVTLNHVTSSDDPDEYMASEDSGFAGASWRAYTGTLTFTLSSGYGTKTVYLKLRNDGGMSATQNDSIDYLETPETVGLVGHWKFDGDLKDLVGLRDATAVGDASAGATNGKIGGALAFDGANDAATISNRVIYGTEFSISFWEFSPASPANSGYFLAAGSSSGFDEIFLRRFNSNNYAGSVSNASPGLGEAPVSRDVWHHNLVTHTASEGGTTKWYVDGVLSKTQTGDSWSKLNNTLYLGNRAAMDRDFEGLIDDLQIYDILLDADNAASLFNNPGSIIAPPSDDFNSYISDPAFGLEPSEQGFALDPDGDGISNGLEAWFGTHPRQQTPGLANVSSNGLITTFTHPQHDDPPSDLSGYYEWSPNLTDWYTSGNGPSGGVNITFAATTVGTTTTVTATPSEAVERIFLRAGVTQNP